MGLFIDITGQRFARLSVLGRAGSTRHKNATWHCVCDCGAACVVSSSDLRRGHTKSCGCAQIEAVITTGKRNRTHGKASGGKVVPEYPLWRGMKSRCYNKKSPQFKNYGARGITVCDEWRNSFAAFYRDMGPRPAPHLTVERKNNNRGYSKSNCVWATKSEQMRNTRFNVLNLSLAREAKSVRHAGGNLSAWARSKGVSESAARKAAIGQTWA